jgi:hypothetical protein
MRLIGLVSWFDEQTAWLAELVASLAAAGISHVVAVDGAYALYPQARGHSGSEQGQIVASAALGAGMGCTIHQPAMPWIGNECEKRTALFALGHLVAVPDDDWLVVADADEVWERASGLAGTLAATDLDAAEVLLYENTQHGRENTVSRKCFRAQRDGISVQSHHAHYVAGDGRVLWDAARPGLHEEALTVLDVEVRHRPTERLAYRTQRRNSYYGARRALSVEGV